MEDRLKYVVLHHNGQVLARFDNFGDALFFAQSKAYASNMEAYVLSENTIQIDEKVSN